MGESPALRSRAAQGAAWSPTDATVLILGESGTGKELVARAIHERSRAARAAADQGELRGVPRELFESEFFGHARGAFTGALRDRVGRFELADGGTLFLDEVGEIPLELQAKLLRVLQEGEFERVGEDADPAGRRAADRRDQPRPARRRSRPGGSAQDLYYRLSVFPIELPPLRRARGGHPARSPSTSSPWPRASSAGRSRG